jgi:GT2 family glycosyltransferase
MSKIDTVIACCNSGGFLEPCVWSTLEQPLGDRRRLIADHASPDDSVLAANILAAAEPRVAIISHGENRSHISTYHEGIAWAWADYFLLLSADELLVSAALKRPAELMDADSDDLLTHGEMHCLVQ